MCESHDKSVYLSRGYASFSQEQRDDRQHDEDEDEYVRDSHRETCNPPRAEEIRNERENDEHDCERGELAPSHLKNRVSNGSDHRLTRPNTVNGCL